MQPAEKREPVARGDGEGTGQMTATTLDMLKVRTGTMIHRPAHEVFEAIVDPTQLTQYFVGRADTRLDAGGVARWSRADGSDERGVSVEAIEPARRVAFRWGEGPGYGSLTDIRLTPETDGSTLVTLSDGPWPNDAEGLIQYTATTQGWLATLLCMKAYLEHGVDLRPGQDLAWQRVRAWAARERGEVA